MRWWHPGRKAIEQAHEKVQKAEQLRDDAQAQQQQVEANAPRVDEVVSSLRQLRQDNHFGPMIEAILRGTK